MGGVDGVCVCVECVCVCVEEGGGGVTVFYPPLSVCIQVIYVVYR